MPTSTPCLRAHFSMVRVAQRNRSLSRGQLLLNSARAGGHGEGDVLPLAVGQNLLLLSNPLLSGLHAAGAAGLKLAALAEEAGVSIVW